MIDRIFKNWKTSLIGLIILIGSMALVYFEKATLIEAGTFIGTAIVLFFMKDEKK